MKRLVSFVLLLAIPLSTQAVTRHVPADYGTIQTAIYASVNGDTVLVAPGTYGGSGNEGIVFDGRAITLLGSGGAEETILLGVSERSLYFGQYDGPDCIVRGFTLRKGDVAYNYGAIGCMEGAAPTFMDLIMEDHNLGSGGWRAGGGLLCVLFSTPSFTNCVFRGNRAGYGGAVYCEDSEIIFTDCLFENNVADNGGAIAGSYGSALTVFERCRFINNRAIWHFEDDYNKYPGRGGAIYLGRFIPVHFSDCLFAGNVAEHCDDETGTAVSGQGGAVISYSRNVVFERCTFHDNEVEPWEDELTGGTFHFAGGVNSNPATIDACILSGTTQGCTIWAASDVVPTVICSVFWDNAEPVFGGECPDLIGVNGNFEADPIFCDPGTYDFTVANTSPCLPENNDCGVQIGAYGQGCVVSTAPDETPAATRLLAPYPNPFNPRVTISFTLAEAGRVRVSVFDLAGRRVTRLADESFPVGRHELIWRGRDDAGHEQSSGVYFLRMEAPGRSEQRRLVLLR